MDAAVWGVIGVVIGGVITGLTTLGVAWVRSNAEQDLDSAKRKDDRRLALDQFQRETLLELQDVIGEVARAAARIHLRDQEHFRETGDWEDTLIAEELDESARATNQRVNALKTRVVDEPARTLVGTILAAQFAIVTAQSEADSIAAMQQVTRQTAAFLDRSGELIRAAYRVE